MDWWESREVSVDGKGKISMTCSKWIVHLRRHSLPARAGPGAAWILGFSSRTRQWPC
jgi:hypothetical protein